MTAHENLNLTDTTSSGGSRARPYAERRSDRADPRRGDDRVPGDGRHPGRQSAGGGRRPLPRLPGPAVLVLACAACGPLFDADPDRYANAA